MKVILIAGRARSGKTKAAYILKDILEKKKEKVVITEYSKYIKLFAKDLLGWDMISEPKPRTFLQEMGEYVRSLKSDIYFVERMKEDLKIYEHFVDVVKMCIRDRKKEELKSTEDRLLQRENSLDKRDEMLQKREISLEEKENHLLASQKDLQSKNEKLDEMLKDEMSRLEKIAHFSKEKALSLIHI